MTLVTEAGQNTSWIGLSGWEKYLRLRWAAVSSLASEGPELLQVSEGKGI